MASFLFSFIFPRTLPLTLTDDMFFHWNSDPEHTVTGNWIRTPTPLLLAFSPSLLLSPSSFFSCCSLSACTEGHTVNIPFRAALYSRAAKLTLCCHESDSQPDSWCHLHRCLTSQSVLKCSLIKPALLCAHTAQCVSAVRYQIAVICGWLSWRIKPFALIFTLETLVEFNLHLKKMNNRITHKGAR